MRGTLSCAADGVLRDYNVLYLQSLTKDIARIQMAIERMNRKNARVRARAQRSHRPSYPTGTTRGTASLQANEMPRD